MTLAKSYLLLLEVPQKLYWLLQDIFEPQCHLQTPCAQSTENLNISHKNIKKKMF